MWSQIVGKVRLALSPNVNHWWGVAARKDSLAAHPGMREALLELSGRFSGKTMQRLN